MTKKIITLVLTLALLVPLSPVQAVGESNDSQKNPVTGLDNIVNTSDVVGCQTGGFGGALAQTFGAALQQAIPGFLRGQLGGALGELAAEAGPFGGLVNSVGNIGIDKLSTYIQDEIGSLFSGSETIGDVGNAAHSALLGNSGVSNAAGSLANSISGAAEVPVKDRTVIQNTEQIKSDQRNHVIPNTLRTAEATETESQKECIGDVLARKLANQALSLLFQSTVDFVNSGFNGEPAFVQNLQQFIGESTNVLVEDFIGSQLSGMCSTQRPTVQRLLLAEYQYETNFGQRVQCNPEEAASAREFESGNITNESLYNSLWNDTLTYDKYFLARSELANRKSGEALSQLFSYVTNDGFKDKIVCSNTGQPPRSGTTVCTAAEGAAQTVFPGTLTSSLTKKQLDLPTDTLLNADEIAEIIDALTGAVTQVALQGIDGLFGLSKSRGSQGSYLDEMVGGSGAVAQNAAREALLRDIESALTLEESYAAAVGAVLDELERVRVSYTQAMQCLTSKSTQGTNQAVAQQKLVNASSTVATVLNPHIQNLSLLESRALDTVDDLDILYTETQSALTPAAIVSISGRYNALIRAGLIHTPADITYLEADLLPVRSALYILAVDAAALKTECQTL